MAGDAGKNKKYGRNKVFCNAYRLSSTDKKNKAKRLLSVMLSQKDCPSAFDALAKLAKTHAMQVKQAARELRQVFGDARKVNLDSLMGVLKFEAN